MKLSRFTLFYDNYPKPGESLAFNTRTQSVIQLNQEVRGFIERVIHRKDAKDAEIIIFYCR